MRKGTISLNQREQQRLKVLNQVERSELSGEDAAVLMGLGLRQVRRLLAAYRREGALLWPMAIGVVVLSTRCRMRSGGRLWTWLGAGMRASIITI